MKRLSLCLALAAAFTFGSCAGESNPSTGNARTPAGADVIADLQGQVDDLSARLEDVEDQLYDAGDLYDATGRLDELDGRVGDLECDVYGC